MIARPQRGKRRARYLAVAGLVLVSQPTLAGLDLFARDGSATQASDETLPRLALSQMEGFVVQAPDALPGAADVGFQGVGDAVIWRKHDWPGRADRTARPEGYQASDSVEETLPGGRLYVQTFDFGDAGRRFERFDLGQGDGGQALVALNGSIYAAMTEDGGAGVQWFVGHGCRFSSEAKAGLRGWLFFDASVVRGAWRDRLARLKVESSLSSCPWFFNDAYTRWRRTDVRFPYRVTVPGASTRQGSFVVDSILSEHYGGSSIATADHLERFWFGRGYGLLRWERWENADRSPRSSLQDDARSLAESGRCAPVEGSLAPGPDWSMVDCRTWTNFVRLPKPWKVAAFNWPRPDVVSQFESAFVGR